MGELRSFWLEEDGVTVVEIILICVVLIALVMLFKNQLISVVNNILGKVATNSNEI